jgi:Holliday junction resolvasome RuvABC endonuclease subunit
MKIVGIDYSMNSPGIVRFYLDNNLDLIKAESLGFTQIKKNQKDAKIIYHKKDQFCNNIEKFVWINDIIHNFLLNEYATFQDDYIALEGYAYGAKGKVFEIGEATGELKKRIWESKVPLRIYDPTSIKMFITGVGNADKELMKKHYKGIIPIEDINEDIIDAYHITSLLQTELKLRKGIVKSQDLLEHQIRVFNRCTKSHPENILVENFIVNLKEIENV